MTQRFKDTNKNCENDGMEKYIPWKWKAGVAILISNKQTFFKVKTVTKRTTRKRGKIFKEIIIEMSTRDEKINPHIHEA